MSVRIGIIGYGEVGQIFAADLLTNGATAVAIYDKIFGSPVAEQRVRMAGELGILVALSAREAVRGADIIISAVTADQAKPVADGVAPFLKAGQIYLDINSASPETKIAVAKMVDASGADFVEGAVMATVPGPRLQVPILGGGSKAVQVASVLNSLGMNINPVTTETGRASAMKLCRSIMIKGLEALIIQCKEASTRWDIEKEVFASLHDTYPGMDWKKLAIQMPNRVSQHGVRRSAEMREAAQMVKALSMDDSLCAAVAQIQASHVGK
ncbi:NAD(P)-binding domain-containing protein [Mesorhizobium sp. ANAO-SY3R2]|uniref:NAD(P)-dependent oxidoreductase n=1 Tax=Mesorhizobium sp. ANAO-SY3R2 TaxID=3166644 RepID=UPI00366D6875